MTPLASVDAPPAHVDVLIIGAGISGIGAGCHLRRNAPDKSFAIIESRDSIGGTWDLFKYPGIRSDSDLQTFGYAFRPWTASKVIAPAEEILAYLRDTVAEYRLDEAIHYGYRVIAADFHRHEALWHVTLRDRDGEETEVTAQFLFAATGYYDYDRGYQPVFPGQDDFAGQLIHPQHWPEDLDYAGKRVVVIGSGATAVTLIPAMADDVEHITMLQRSPSYVVSQPAEDPIITFLKKHLSDERAFAIARGFNIRRQSLVYQLCKRYPGFMRKVLINFVTQRLPEGYPVDVHFNPSYNPWDERLCVVPNGDLFKAIRQGKASVATGTIDHFDATGIVLASGEHLDADIIVSATGLNLKLFGGIEVSVEGEPVDFAQTVAFRSMMPSGVPNVVFALGYTNASWTLKVDLVCEHMTRILEHMDRTGQDTFVAEPNGPLELRPLLDFQAGYVQRVLDQLPKQGGREPWTVAMRYATDRKRLIDGPVTDPELHFSRARQPATAAA